MRRFSPSFSGQRNSAVGAERGHDNEAHLPALLVLSICAGGWSCSSQRHQRAGRCRREHGARGAVGIAGNGTVATGGNVGAAGASSALGGNTSCRGHGRHGAGTGGSAATSGAGTAGSASGGVGLLERGPREREPVGTSGTGGGSIGGGSSMGGSPGTCSAIANTATRRSSIAPTRAKLHHPQISCSIGQLGSKPRARQCKLIHPEFTVAADGSGTHPTIQAAINAAASGAARRYILIKPGSLPRRGFVLGRDSDPPCTVWIRTRPRW